jgi:hypothetical protein
MAKKACQGRRRCYPEAPFNIPLALKINDHYSSPYQIELHRDRLMQFVAYRLGLSGFRFPADHQKPRRSSTKSLLVILKFHIAIIFRVVKLPTRFDPAFCAAGVPCIITTIVALRC